MIPCVILYGISSILAQPGPMYININDGFGDVTVIDSTSDLSRIKLLKNVVRLNIQIKLEKIPKEFEGFKNVESLVIEGSSQLKDLAGLQYFENIQELFLYRYEGQSISTKELKLDHLKYFRISNSDNLNNIDCLKKIQSIEKLYIQSTPNIKKFPKFEKGNCIQLLEIDHVSHDRKEGFEGYLNNIRYLSKLKSLTLANIKGINKIPGFLPDSISRLIISGWALKHWDDEKIVIQDMSNLSKYKKLKSLTLYYVHILPEKMHYQSIELEELILKYVRVYNDISWVFKFRSLNYLWLIHIFDLVRLESEDYSCVPTKIEIEKAPELKSLDFLFTLKGIQKLEVKGAEKLKLPYFAQMENIPTIWVYYQGQSGFHKKNNMVILPESEYVKYIYDKRLLKNILVYEYGDVCDIDNDGKYDSIQFIGNGRVQTYFIFRLKLSSTGNWKSFPTFQIDMPYLDEYEGQDLKNGSVPQFIVHDFDKDGMDEIYLNMDNDFSSIPIEFQKNGLKSKRILFDYNDGKLELRKF